MSCQLSPDDSGQFNFLTSTGAQITVCAGGGNVHIDAATLNGNGLTPDADGKVAFTAVAGRNLLNLDFSGPDPEEEFPIQEVCDAAAGTTQDLLTRRHQPTSIKPGGPTKLLRINAS